MKTNAYSGGNTVSQHSFAQVTGPQVQRSVFNRSSGYKTTFDSGKLIPVFLDHAIPGDTMTLQPTFFARMATPIFPLIDNMHLDYFFFSVPYRLLWEYWPYFMGEEEEIGDSELPAKYEIPCIVSGAGGFDPMSMADYFGIPPDVPNLRVSALPFRAFNQIYNQWFRDQNLIDRVIERKLGGVLASPGVPGTSTVIDLVTDYALKPRGKRHDYFTSSLPWPQKGANVLLPLGTSAPIRGESTLDLIQGTGAPVFSIGTRTGPIELTNNYPAREIQFDATGGSGSPMAGTNLVWNDVNLTLNMDNNTDDAVYADLAAAIAPSINDLRLAFQVQKLLERDARGGTRLIELILSHFGVMSPDLRTQRPEFLGGGSVPITVNPVPQTSGTGADGQDTPQGNLSAFITAAGSGRGFSKSFTEHCVVMGLVSIRADLNYQQGVHRDWFNRTRYDFFWPALQQIGEQSVLSREIWVDGSGTEAAGTGDWSVWGYQEAWAHLRYKPSLITGQFRSDHATSLDAWHLAQDFASRPTLSESFINDTPPVSRVVAVPSEPEFLLDAHFNLRHVRPLPTFSTPGLIDHF